MTQNDATLALIAAIYRSATEPMEWSVVLETLAKLFGGHAAFTMTVGAGAHETDLTCFNLPNEAFVAYGEYYYQHDLWSQALLSQGLNTVDRVYSVDQLVDKAVFKRSVWFNEFLRPLDIEHSMYTSLSADPASTTILAIDRPLGSAHFSQADREYFTVLVGHISRAQAIAKQLQSLKAGIDAHETAINQLNIGIISINLNTNVLYANELALNWLDKHEGLTIKNGLLCSMTVSGQQHLTSMLNLAKSGIGHRWMLVRPVANSALMIKSLPLLMAEVTPGLPNDLTLGKVLLLLTEANAKPTNSYEQFTQSYRLTPQEGKVLQGLVAGYSLKEIAERHQVSYNTVRSQLATLLQKTDCHRQKDLLRLFFSGQKSDL
jgi:DNA-binding CsgD family transcriptional regulator/PAS domain-containing protein